MSQEGVVAAVQSLVRNKFEGEGSGHDWWHIHRVYNNAVSIAKEEKADLYVVELASLLHDIKDWKFHDGDEGAGPREARRILESLLINGQTISRVCTIIKEVSYKGAGVDTKPSNLEGCIVQDADRLDALGAIGIARCFAYGGSKKRTMHDPRQKPTMHADFEAYKNSKGTSVNHFYEKLLLLKDRMNTEAGKKAAEKRHQYMEDFLKQFYSEWDGK